MTRLPALTYREVIQHLRAAGFVFDRQAKGSHEIWYNSQSRRRVTVPHHPGVLPRGTLRAIIHETGLTVEAFLGEQKEDISPSQPT
ncbi:MAG: type II toxin-antitoxin system HicA family toxin [Anaerolineae bacterium]|nr:type II toxin-antitoxin system HicA family toxin [Anaerolineae bacterium]